MLIDVDCITVHWLFWRCLISLVVRFERTSVSEQKWHDDMLWRLACSGAGLIGSTLTGRCVSDVVFMSSPCFFCCVKRKYVHYICTQYLDINTDVNCTYTLYTYIIWVFHKSSMVHRNPSSDVEASQWWQVTSHNLQPWTQEEECQKLLYAVQADCWVVVLGWCWVIVDGKGGKGWKRCFRKFRSQNVSKFIGLVSVLNLSNHIYWMEWFKEKSTGMV